MNVAALQQKYGERLRQRVTAVGQAVASRADGASLSRQFHSIAGLAGTIGFDHATAVAREGELLAAEPNADFDVLSSIVGRLQSAIEGSPALHHAA